MVPAIAAHPGIMVGRAPVRGSVQKYKIQMSRSQRVTMAQLKVLPRRLRPDLQLGQSPSELWKQPSVFKPPLLDRLI